MISAAELADLHAAAHAHSTASSHGMLQHPAL
jgi:hypothetical protein